MFFNIKIGIFLISLSFIVSLVKSKDGYEFPHFYDGRDSIIELFGWKYTDIANECVQVLRYSSYGGVQISPVTENRQLPGNESGEMYQPVSFEIMTRRGNEYELQQMIQACNSVGIRVYVEVALNHMAPGGYNEVGFAGSRFSPAATQYPYMHPNDFHRQCDYRVGVDEYNIETIRDCRLFGMPDLNHGSRNIQTLTISFLNKLIGLGVAGFRIDAARHMWPQHLLHIFSRLYYLNTNMFGPERRPFIYYEVIDVGQSAVTYAEYVSVGRVTNFFAYKQLNQELLYGNPRSLLYTYGTMPSNGNMDSEDSIVFVEHHERGRGIGFQNAVVYNIKPVLSVVANAFMLAHPYGLPSILSSYFDTTKAAPIGMSMDGNVCGNNMFYCEHRLLPIKAMNTFRVVTKGAPVVYQWQDPQYNFMAFTRSGRGFVAFNFTNTYKELTIQTDLPAGAYCDIIAGGLATKYDCYGIRIDVSPEGIISTRIPPLLESSVVPFNGWPIIAIHVDSAVSYM